MFAEMPLDNRTVNLFAAFAAHRAFSGRICNATTDETI
jgi:hypothetical protein